MDGMNNLRGVDGLLGERVMREMVKGGPAHFRPSHQGNDLHALHQAELRNGEGQAVMKHRLLSMKLPGLPLISVRLPKWLLVGRLVA
jgi:hypothetical protein